MMYAWSPAANHWFKFSVAVMLLVLGSKAFQWVLCRARDIGMEMAFDWGVDILESPPVLGSVPLNTAGSPTQAYDMMADIDVGYCYTSSMSVVLY